MQNKGYYGVQGRYLFCIYFYVLCVLKLMHALIDNNFEASRYTSH